MWVAGASLAALLLQSVVLERTGSGSQEQETSDDKSLTWREDEGISKLVPLLPEPAGSGKKPLAKYTMKEVAQHSTRDDLWIIVDARVYNVTRFVDKHPGGALPLENMAGKDCTDVFANYHPARVYKYQLPAMLVGEVTDYEVYPHVADFRAVRQELLRKGLFETDIRSYAKLGAFIATLFFLAIGCSMHGTSTATRLLGAVFLGLFWQQLAGIGHDLGHSGVTHVFWLDHIIGSVLASLLGISMCWWKRNHNTHHVVCNSVEHDPDIQHMPMLAVTSKVFEKPFWSTYYTKWVNMDDFARFMVSNQAILFYPIMMVARFNLYAQSFMLLCSKELAHYRYTEFCSFVVFFTWVGSLALSMPTWGESIGWLLLSHATSGLLHVQIVISHWSMDTYHGHAYNDDTDDWYITQLKTTMNVDTPACLDWIHIGLQFQIEHHLFPRLPRHNLRIARDMVKAVCKKHNIYYHEPGFFAANVEIVRTLLRTAASASSAKLGKSGFYESILWDGMTLNG